MSKQKAKVNSIVPEKVSSETENVVEVKEHISEEKETIGVVTAFKLNLRSTPDADNGIKNIVNVVGEGTKLVILDSVGLFYAVRLVDDDTNTVPLYGMQAFIEVR